MSAAIPVQRKALRRREVRAMYGASLHQVDAAIRSGEIRTKQRGRCLFLHPGDVESVFGFEETIEPSRESVADLADFLR